MIIEEAARAKVNICLHVTGRRADGYHLVDSLVAFADAADTVSAKDSDGLTLRVTGPYGPTLAAEPDNLVLRAARALADAAGVPANAALSLEKRLPVASGIGGGSADAAATLRALARLWRLDPEATDLLGVAAGLGADVPVCVASAPARMRGIGERLDPMPKLPPCFVALVNPGVGVATPAVFRARHPGFSPPLDLAAGWPDLAALVDWLGHTRNDLEAAARTLCPAIGDVLAFLRAIPGCRMARMSGSGATCFGLFDTAPEIGGLPDGWWSWPGLPKSGRRA